MDAQSMIALSRKTGLPLGYLEGKDKKERTCQWW